MAKTRYSYQLHIQLQDTQPAVWRRIVVADVTTLAHLHHVMAAAMGWTVQRNFAIEIAGQRYGLPSPDHPDDPTMDARRYTLAQLLQGHALPMRYVHDLHSHWRHRVRVEACLPATLPASPPPPPRCIAGRNACPPLGIQSAAAYAEWLTAQADRSHPGSRTAQRLHDGLWTPAAFDVAAAQGRLQSIPPTAPAVPTKSHHPLRPGMRPQARGIPAMQQTTTRPAAQRQPLMVTA